MIIQDYALIYRKNNNLYYAISKKNGKIILKNNFSKTANFETDAFYFVYYDYLLSNYKLMQFRNNGILDTEDFTLDFVSFCNNSYLFNRLFCYIFDLHIKHNLSIDQYFTKLVTVYQKEHTTKKEIFSFIFDLFIYLQLCSSDEIHNFLIILEKSSFLDIKEFLKKICLDNNPSHQKLIHDAFKNINF